MDESLLVSLSIVFCLVFSAHSMQGQLVEEFHPTKDACCLQAAAQTLTDQLQDWNQLSHYYEENQRLQSQPLQQGRVVFLGDSITLAWDLPKFFPGRPYVNRGIGGQTTQQMLVRMFPDVLDLHPAAVIILAGINDIGRHTGPVTAKMVEENLQAMTELAQKHDIKVILCSVLPVRANWTLTFPAADILKLNGWITHYAAQSHAEFADYYSAFADSNGMMKEDLSHEGIHPNAKGQALMVTVAEAAIAKALK
jgi:lysophospholipase L1-like esterase